MLEYNPGNGSKKRPRIVLDLGATPVYCESIRANTVLISHGHLDHVGAIFSHARAHSVTCSGSVILFQGFADRCDVVLTHLYSHFHRSVPTYYVPEVIREKVEQARDAMAALDGDDRSFPMKIIGVQPGDEVELPIRGLFCRVFAVTHASCPAVGYVIGSRHAPVLKEEYRGLNKSKISELVSNGISIKAEPLEELEVSYTGDTSVDGLLGKNDAICESESKKKSTQYMQQAFQCRLLLCEASFLDDSEKAKDLSAKRGHLHIEDIARVLEENKFARDDRRVVLLHISGRYNAKGAMDHIADAIPSKMASRCLVAISSHLEQFRKGKGWSRFVRGDGCILLSDYIREHQKSQAKD